MMLTLFSQYQAQGWEKENKSVANSDMPENLNAVGYVKK